MDTREAVQILCDIVSQAKQHPRQARITALGVGREFAEPKPAKPKRKAAKADPETESGADG